MLARKVLRKEISSKCKAMEIVVKLFVRRFFRFKQKLFAPPQNANQGEQAALRIRERGEHLRVVLQFGNVVGDHAVEELNGFFSPYGDQCTSVLVKTTVTGPDVVVDISELVHRYEVYKLESIVSALCS